MNHITPADWLAQCPLPRLEKYLLVQHATRLTRAQLLTRDHLPLTAKQQQHLQALLQRRLAGEPMAYILGTRGFYGRDFVVSPAVLIPRPETEHLLEAALAHLPEHGTLWDIGTGSGIIAITAKLERPDAHVFASDVCATALTVARGNAATLGADITFAQGSWLDVQPAPPLCQIIVSNPPYIEADDPHLHTGDLRFEPQHALTDFSDGLSAYRHIAAAAPAHLHHGGWLLFEHGYQQGAAVRQILRDNGFQSVATLPDLAGHERVSFGQFAPL